MRRSTKVLTNERFSNERGVEHRAVRGSIGRKRIATLAGLLCLLTIPVAPASAVSNAGLRLQTTAQPVGVTSVHASGTNPAVLGEANAVLTGVGASSIPITVWVENPVLLPFSSGAEFSVTAVVAMGQVAGAIQPKAQFSGDACGYDGSYSVFECVTMYYNIKSDAWNYYADDSQVSIKPVNYDTHDAVLSSLSLTAGGSGYACTGSGHLAGGQTWNISSPSSGTTYYRTPSWSGNYYVLNSSSGAFQNVQGTLYWYYRGNAEQLKFTYSLPDSESGWPTGGC